MNRFTEKNRRKAWSWAALFAVIQALWARECTDLGSGNSVAGTLLGVERLLQLGSPGSVVFGVETEVATFE